VAKIAAVHESIDHLADDRVPSTVLFGEAFLVKTLELIEVVFHQSEKRRSFGVARKIDAVDTFRHILPNGEIGVLAKLIDISSGLTTSGGSPARARKSSPSTSRSRARG